jgi:hypothetical protein
LCPVCGAALTTDAALRRHVNYMVGWLVGWLAGWLAGWLIGWLAGWLAVGGAGC